MSMLSCRPTLPTPRFSPLPTPSTSMRPLLNVGRRVVSHQHLKDATTLVLSLLRVAKFQPASESSQKTGRLDKGPFLGRRPMLKRTHISHQHLKDAKTLVEPALQSSNQRQSLPQKTGRLDKNAFLGRRPVLNRTHTSRQRLEDATEPLLALMRPA